MTTDPEALTYDHIVALALGHGFKLKRQADGRMALNDYVIDFARAVYDIGHAAAKAETAAAVAKERERATDVLAACIPAWDGQEAVDGGDLIRMLIGAICAGAKERGE